MEVKRIPTIGHYQIVNSVGKGSYGACFSAVNKKKARRTSRTQTWKNEVFVPTAWVRIQSNEAFSRQK